VRKLVLLSALLLLALRAPAQSKIENQNSKIAPPAAELSITDAIILGTVEGITEYLPISSTGHLIIATHALGLDETATLRGRDGQPLWFKKPSAKHPAGEPLTLKLAADTYTVVIQFGAIAAVALLYWRQIRSMIFGLLGRDPDGFRLLRNVLIAFFPAAVVGLAMDKLGLELFSVPTVIAAQIVGAFIIFWAESYRRRRAASASLDLTPRQSLNIGLLQCLSLWPGMSRSMTTIVGGYLAGLDPRRAAEFSFLLGFVTLTAATGYKSLRSGAAMIQVFGVPHVLLGCVIAAVTAAVAVKFLVGWLSRHGMQVFAWYRLAFAALLAAITWL
jgi:undecaprenyl-diphosphatase